MNNRIAMVVEGRTLKTSRLALQESKNEAMPGNINSATAAIANQKINGTANSAIARVTNNRAPHPRRRHPDRPRLPAHRR
jgi:hypothetical protein